MAHLEATCSEIQVLLQQHAAQFTDLKIEMIGVREEISLLREELGEKSESPREEEHKRVVKKES